MRRPETSAVIALVVTLLVGLVMGYMLGMWHEYEQVTQERDSAIEQLRVCVSRNVAEEVTASTHRERACIEQQGKLCDTRIEQLRVSFIRMKCELCK